MSNAEPEKNPRLTEFEEAFNLEIDRLKRRAKIVTIVGVGALVIFAYRAHQENLMWRQEITDILRASTSILPRY